MSSLGTSKGVLEIAKFGVYVSVPVALTYLVATDSKTLKKLMGLVRSFLLALSLNRRSRREEASGQLAGRIGTAAARVIVLGLLAKDLDLDLWLGCACACARHLGPLALGFFCFGC